MKRQVYAASGRTTSTEYIKRQLFDYLCDECYLKIDDQDADTVYRRRKALAPIFDVDDVISLAIDEGIKLTEALARLEDEYDQM